MVTLNVSCKKIISVFEFAEVCKLFLEKMDRGVQWLEVAMSDQTF